MYDAHAHLAEKCTPCGPQLPPQTAGLHVCLDHRQLQHLTATNSTSQTRVMYSCGLHPWQLGATDQGDADQFMLGLASALHAHPQLGVGEYGLDKQHAHPLAVQYFRAHWQLARHYARRQSLHLNGQQHLYLQLLKTLHYREQCVLLHAFNASAPMLQQLRRYPHYYSFGPRQLQRPQIRSLIAAIPPAALLFESDLAYPLQDHSAQELQHAYELYCHIIADVHGGNAQTAARQLQSNYAAFAAHQPAAI